MRKRLFCLFMVFTMLNASMAVQAAGIERQTETKSEVSEEETDGTKQTDEQGDKEIDDVIKTPDIIPETSEEPDAGMEKTETPAPDQEPASDPITTPISTPGQDTDSEPGKEPTTAPEIELTALPEMTSTPEAISSPESSVLPNEDDMLKTSSSPDVIPSPSMSPTPSVSPVAILESVEDELVGGVYESNWTIANNETLSDNCTVKGNLIVDSNRTLNVGNYRIDVMGDVIANGNITLASGILNVEGDYRQEGGHIDIENGEVNVRGNFRLQTLTGGNQYGTSEGHVRMLEGGGKLNIDGSFIMKSSKATGNYVTNFSRGTLTLKGDLLQLSAGNNDYFAGNVSNGFRLVMAGSGQQTILLENALSNLGNVYFDNQDIVLQSSFGGKLQTNIDPKINGDSIKTSNLDLNGHYMTLPAHLYIEKDGVKLNGGNLAVQGNVTATAVVSTDGAGSLMTVSGSYLQESSYLEVGSGQVTVGRDFRIQSVDANNQYSNSTGHVRMLNAGGRLNIDGNFVMQSSNATGSYVTNFGNGTLTLKGDLLQLPAGNKDYFSGNAQNGFKLIMAGSGQQKLSLISEKNTLGNIQFDNKNVIVQGCMNATLASDGIINAAESGSIDVTGLKLNNHRLEVAGNIKASGNVTMGGTNGCLIVAGNYVQTSGSLKIDGGRMDVAGDLRMQGQNAYGNYDVGSGYLEMSDASGRLNVDGDIVVQSTKNCNLSRGQITLLGSMVQNSSNGAVGYIRSNESHTVILASNNPQGLQFDNGSSKVGTLQLTRDKSDYWFSYEPCWIKLVLWPFSDVAINEGNWKYDSVKYVYINNIMNGINGTTRFDPDEPLTRAMFATVLYRMAGNPSVQFQNKFEDVKPGAYYSNAVIWAYSQGIVNGLDGGRRYGINEFITREQIAKMLKEYGRVMKYTMNESASLDSFPDRSDVSGWAVGYMQWAVGSGMVTGKNIGGTYYLDPKGNATRAECAAMLTRFMKRY